MAVHKVSINYTDNLVSIWCPVPSVKSSFSLGLSILLMIIRIKVRFIDNCWEAWSLKSKCFDINVGCFSELLQTKGLGCDTMVDSGSCPSHIMHSHLSLRFIIYNRAFFSTVVSSNLQDVRVLQQCWYRSKFSGCCALVNWLFISLTLYCLAQIIL